MDKAYQRKNIIKYVKICSLCFLAWYAADLWALQSGEAGEWRFFRRAFLKNESGHQLRLDTYGDHQLRIWLILKGKEPGVFSNKLPIFKIDQGPVYQVKSFEEKNIRIREDRWLHFQGADENKEFAKILNELKFGEQVVFQYYPPDGSIREAVFELSGIESVIDWLQSDLEEAD